MTADLKIQVLDPLCTPEKGTTKSACYDLKVRKVETIQEFYPDSQVIGVVVYLGVKMHFPEEFVGKIYARSSITTKGNGWIIPNGVGIIDPDYSGELKAIYQFVGNAYTGFSDGLIKNILNTEDAVIIHDKDPKFFDIDPYKRIGVVPKSPILKDFPYKTKGQSCCQFRLEYSPITNIEFVDDIEPLFSLGGRGEGGFGSTDK